MASIGFGLALSMTGGVPVYGMPSQFGATLGFGKLLGVPVPVYVTVVVILGMYVLLNWTRIGRYFYAIGGNIKASALSGISTRSYLFLAYVLCGFLASLGGVMLTARLETGQAHIGAAMPLRSIAACLIGAARSRPRGVPAGTQAPGRGIPPRRAQPHARAGRGAGRGRGCRRRLGGGSGGAREARGQHAGRRSGDRDAGRGVRSRREGRAGPPRGARDAQRRGLKDIRLVLRTADQLGVPMPVAGVAYDHFLSAASRGRGGLDWTAVSEVVREAAGLAPAWGSSTSDPINVR